MPLAMHPVVCPANANGAPQGPVRVRCKEDHTLRQMYFISR